MKIKNIQLITYLALIFISVLYTPTNVFAEAKKVSPAEMHLISPVDGQVFESGDTIKFVIDPDQWKDIRFFKVDLDEGGGDINDTPPFELQFKTSQYYIGPVKAIVTVFNKNKKAIETEIHLQIRTSSPIEKIYTYMYEGLNGPEGTHIWGLSEEYQTHVRRLYKNESMETITTSPDTKYRTKSFFKSKVITVSPTGLVKAIGNGTETVIIENGGFETSILFTVNDKNFPPAKPDSPIKDGLYIIIPILIAMITIAVYVGKKVFRFLGSSGSK